MNTGANNACHELEYIFHPRSVVVVGVSPDPNRYNVGRFFVTGLVNLGYKGRIYAVGLEGGEFEGRTIYQNIKDVPDTIDYAMVAIPSRSTVQLVRDAAEKGVRLMHFFTAGFSETGGEAETSLQQELSRTAREAGIRILGPNCMGIYYPEGGLTFNPEFPHRSGTTGFISQSGGNSIYAAHMARRRGLFYSKIISYGNGSDINESDLLEYLSCDPETEIINLYVEGVRDGTRFLRVLRRAAKIKPVIVYKGGLSVAGSHAAMSHTGSIAGSDIVWRAAVKQAGAVQVNDIDEMMDLSLLFEKTKPAPGRNTAIIGVGGGNSVLVADTWAAAGLAVPVFSEELRQHLRLEFDSEAGSSFRNPMDIFAMFTMEALHQVITILSSRPEIDNILVHLPVGLISMVTANPVTASREVLVNLPPEIKRRLLVVLYSPFTMEDIELTRQTETALYEAGIPVFPSIVRAARALKLFKDSQDLYSGLKT